MATAVILPKQGNSVESCIIQSWLKQPGDQVAAGEALCEVETDKAVVEIEAPADGVLIDTFFAVDDDVPVLETIAAIGEAGEDVSNLRPGGTSESSPAGAAEAGDAAPAPTQSPAPAPAPELAAVGSSAAAGSSPRARSLAAEHGVAIAEVPGSGPGGRVIERDVQAAAQGRARLTAAAQQKLAADPSLAAPERGSGPDGLVQVEDLVAKSAVPAPAVTAAAVAPGTVTSKPVKGIRKIIAERMRASLTETAQLTLNARFRCRALQAYRKQVKAQGEALGLPNITINDMIVFACSRVLPRHPAVNARFLGDRIEQHADVNLGVAVDTDRGLMVPVLPRANRQSLAQLAAAFKPLAQAAIGGSIAPEQLQGGTFTITNLGALGITDFTPVLNAPEVAILGVGGITLQPYRNADGEVVFEDTIGLSLTIDHQALDGAPAARFLADLVAALESFDLLLAG